jgi:hypothetical protein
MATAVRVEEAWSDYTDGAAELRHVAPWLYDHHHEDLIEPYSRDARAGLTIENRSAARYIFGRLVVPHCHRDADRTIFHEIRLALSRDQLITVRRPNRMRSCRPTPPSRLFQSFGTWRPGPQSSRRFCRRPPSSTCGGRVRRAFARPARAA